MLAQAQEAAVADPAPPAGFGHVPVLPEECLKALDVRPSGRYADLTLGGGGHSRLILDRLGPEGRLLALDVDPEALEWARGWGGGDPRLVLRRASFAGLRAILDEEGLLPLDGMLADLGTSSRQTLSPERGFSFSADGPLDMRLDPAGPVTAADLVNGLPEKELADLVYRLSGERASRKLARAIALRRASRPFRTTLELADLARSVVRPPSKGKRIHPATRLFLALRAAVNREQEALEALLGQARGCLRPGGRLCVVSFHSLEDRLVKELFRPGPQGSPRLWSPLWKKPLVPGPEERLANPRSRSARLRAAERTGWEPGGPQ
ncbi:MAG: 16S rRNA (cytosine(1402)-N(4))-methyltransferase RsmH [Deltaproteobacteria bacterium]|jgi:16S rRNA (cytosine1402-N4)-methyltransferase|nr:16S rRNA (cytosine(1402)-N(4))-methyltransferase RsmH [Deltaproteobacteria bacterium]